jgi:hypothetical protein
VRAPASRLKRIPGLAVQGSIAAEFRQCLALSHTRGKEEMNAVLALKLFVSGSADPLPSGTRPFIPANYKTGFVFFRHYA